MTHKTKKLSVAIIAFIAAICMFVAILGFVGMPEKANAALASTHTERIAEADAVDKTNVKSHMLYSNKSTKQLMTSVAPGEGATKVFLEYTPIYSSDTSGGSYFLQVYDASGAGETVSSVYSGYFSNALAVKDSRAVIMFDIETGEFKLDRASGTYRDGSTTNDLTTYYRIGFWLNGTAEDASILFKDVKAYDNMGNDLGWVSSDNSFVEVDYAVNFYDDSELIHAIGAVANSTVKEFVPAKDGYAFEGWYTDKDLTVRYNFSTAVTKDINLYAKWNFCTAAYSVKATASSAAISFLTRLAPSANATSVYFEYTLGAAISGTYASAVAYTDGFSSSTSVGPTNSHVGGINTKYITASEYLIAFDLTTNYITWRLTASDQTILYKAPSKNLADYAFFGFKVNTTVTDLNATIRAYDNTGKDLMVTTATSTTVSIDLPEVTFNADNGSAATKTTVSGATVAEPTAPTKDGYRFLGWYKDGQALAYDFATEVTGDMTLTAKWAKIERVYSHAGDSAKSFYTKETPATGATKVYLAYVPKTLYGTGGGGNVGLSATNGTETTTNWKPAEGGGFSWQLNTHFFVPDYSYVISVDLNTGAAENRDHQLRMTATFDTEKFNHFGIWTNGCTEIAFSWEVVAWDNTGKDLGVMFVDGTWNKHDYTATFNTDCDTVINPVGIEAGTKLAQPAALTKDGKYFAGWYTDSAFGNAYDFDSVVNADVTLYAKWVDFDAYYANVLTMGGASARLDESVAKSGIRFTVNVNTALLSELAGEGYNYTLGTLIVPLDYVTDGAPTMESLDASGLGYYNIVSTYESGESYYGTLANVKQENYGRKWVALGYVAIDMGDDTVKYIYAEYDESNAKSIYDVAESFYNEYKDDVDEVENVEIAAVYVDSVVVLDSGYQAVDKVTENALPYTVSAAGNVITVTVNDGVDFVIKSVVIDGKIAKVNVAADGKSATYEVVQQ